MTCGAESNGFHQFPASRVSYAIGHTVQMAKLERRLQTERVRHKAEIEVRQASSSFGDSSKEKQRVSVAGDWASFAILLRRDGV